MKPCTSRYMSHTAFQGIPTYNSNFVVATIYFFSNLDLDELWIGFGSGKNYKELPIHEIHAALGSVKQEFFHYSTLFLGATLVHKCLALGRNSHGLDVSRTQKQRIPWQHSWTIVISLPLILYSRHDAPDLLSLCTARAVVALQPRLLFINTMVSAFASGSAGYCNTTLMRKPEVE